MELKTHEAGTIVIGSGCAGLNACDWLYKFGEKDIALLTEGMNVGTSRNTGSDKQTYYKLSLAGDFPDSVGLMAKTLFDGGGMDGDTAICEAANSALSFMKLKCMGVQFPVNEYGEFTGYKTDHDPCQRGTSTGPYTSKQMTEALENEVRKNGVKIFDGYQAIKILVNDGGVCGLIALNLNNLEENYGMTVFYCRNIVLATGGPAVVYRDSVYPRGHTGASSLALEAGAEFCNLSEWQYGLASTGFRWNVSGTYQQVLPRYISVDKENSEREILLDYYADKREAVNNEFLKGYEWPFDVRKINGSSNIDLIVYNETVIKGNRIYMDFRREPAGLESGFSGLGRDACEYLKNSGALLPLPIERLEKMNPRAVSLYKENGIDLSAQPLEIAVCAQHNNGGIQVDCDWQTNIGGLYAAGEAAGTLGIYRPGGSALNSCQVGGLRCARHISSAVTKNNMNRADFDKLADKETGALIGLIEKTRAKESNLFDGREKLQKQMSRDFSFIRNLAAMEKTVKSFENERIKFTQKHKWAQLSEIPLLFKNLDMVLMQEAVSKSMSYTASAAGSRGSGLVIKNIAAAGGLSALKNGIISEQTEYKTQKQITVKESGAIRMYFKKVREMPQRDNWFESVWNKYNDLNG